MKRWFISLGVLSLFATAPFVAETPLAAQTKNQTSIAQAETRPDVQLNLAAAKQVITQDAEGKKIVNWENMGSEAVVLPGDVLKFTISGNNSGKAAANDMIVTQPIPEGTSYILSSAKGSNGARITYSIDNGRTFVEQPMITVTLIDGTKAKRPAPPQAYTHVRWQFREEISPETAVSASYKVQVR